MTKVYIYTDDWGNVEWEMSFNDYIWLMWDLKTKAFITLWNKVINKMHILNVDTDLSPIVSMSISDFIHQQKEKICGGYDSREKAYSEWCDEILHSNAWKDE